MAGKTRVSPSLQKSPTGIPGFDEVTLGGLPRGRPTLICGSAGCGKTLFAMQFLVRGATEYKEPGAFLVFEETPPELVENFASLGFEIPKLVERGLLTLDHVRLDRSEIEESGEYDLEGLFLRLGYAIDSVGAKRVVIDTIETLFGGFSNLAILRSELGRLFRWLKEKGVTAIVTAERGDATLTRHGLEEYVSDCVILLDHRVSNLVSTRRMRVVKYRGSNHGTNEYPFLIDENGVTVVPITSANLDHPVSEERVSTGVARLDTMLNGRGYFRGSTVLVSGTAGTGKSSLCAHFAHSTCARGERCLFFTFEESPQQLVRNMRSIGIHLDRWIKKGLLRFQAARPTTHGLEMHLAHIHQAVEDFGPTAVVLDPVSNFTGAGSTEEAGLMLVRLIDFLKSNRITTVLTTLTSGGDALERTDVGISSIVDTWLLLKSIELPGERNRGLYVLKSRGMPHSNQIRELVITSGGLDLLDVYTGPDGVLTGSARLAQQARDKAARSARDREIERKHEELEQRRASMEQQIQALRAEFRAYEDEVQQFVRDRRAAENQLELDREQMAEMRGVDPNGRSDSGKGAPRSR